MFVLAPLMQEEVEVMSTKDSGVGSRSREVKMGQEETRYHAGTENLERLQRGYKLQGRKEASRLVRVGARDVDGDAAMMSCRTKTRTCLRASAQTRCLSCQGRPLEVESGSLLRKPGVLWW